MQEQRILIFEPFCLDVGNERLWRVQEALHLTHKAFAVLHYLAEHAGQLVTKDELLEVVWSQTHVSEAALAVCIREIRQALGDHPRTPRFIETVHGRGYRFLAAVTVADRLPASPPLPVLPSPPPLLVGREVECAQMQQWWAKAVQGERQVGFVTGEAGIGKTTLVEAFIARVGGDGALWIGHGQCIEQYGAGDAYLPVLEALGRLCRGPEGQHFMALLDQYAPSWLVQMPTLLSAAELDALQRRGRGATQARMLRELAEAMEALTAERPLILVLEDLQWSDYATLEWLACVARRREKAQLLVIGTYRPMDVLVRAHPLRTVVQELQRHGQCAELPLAYLTEAGVAAYLAARYAGRPLPEGLARLIQRRTGGNPLFMVSVVDAMVRQGLLQEGAQAWTVLEGLEAVAVGLPESLRHLIEQQLGQVSPEDRRVLEAASVAGVEFSAAAVAAGVNSWRRSTSRNDVPPWPAGSSFCRPGEQRNGRTGRWRRGMASSTRCTKRACTSGCRQGGVCGCISASARGRRPGMAHRRGRSPRHWRSISSAGGTPVGPCSICGRPGAMPCSAVPIGRRSST